jgi:hypothetical protein
MSVLREMQAAGFEPDRALAGWVRDLSDGYRAFALPGATGWRLVVRKEAGEGKGDVLDIGTFVLNPAPAVIEACRELEQALALTGPPLHGFEPCKSMKILKSLRA